MRQRHVTISFISNLFDSTSCISSSIFVRTCQRRVLMTWAYLCTHILKENKYCRKKYDQSTHVWRSQASFFYIFLLSLSARSSDRWILHKSHLSLPHLRIWFTADGRAEWMKFPFREERTLVRLAPPSLTRRRQSVCSWTPTTTCDNQSQLSCVTDGPWPREEVLQFFTLHSLYSALTLLCYNPMSFIESSRVFLLFLPTQSVVR